MINIPDWITAGTAVTAVMGGLFGVYSSTQSELSVERERLNSLVEVVARIGSHQEQLSLTTIVVRERMVKSEVVATYLQQGQVDLTKDTNEMHGELRAMNSLLIKIYAHQGKE